jgi:transcriptional regulator with XRE-family HTH domain
VAKKKTQRKTTTRKKKAKASKAARRPSWSVVTYEQIEAWREQQGLPKKRMATLLGVTNSTYHNWARGIAVATYNTQRKIREILDRGEVPAELASAPGRGRPRGAGGNPSGNSATPGHPSGGSSRLQELTVDLVKAYVEANPGKVTPDALIDLIGQVRAQLG